MLMYNYTIYHRAVLGIQIDLYGFNLQMISLYLNKQRGAPHTITHKTTILLNKINKKLLKCTVM